MRKPLTLMAMAAAIALPLMLSATDADAASCRTRKVNGTLLGAAGGALLGNAIGNNGTGTIVGGLGGAVVGREIGRKGCAPRRAYYRSSQVRPAQYRSSGSRYEAPRPVERKVYYDQHGTPIAYDR